MSTREQIAAAQSILGIPLFNELMDGLEAAEINGAVNAAYDDHEKRQAHMAALRAIRNLRSRIGALATEGQPSERKQAPA